MKCAKCGNEVGPLFCGHCRIEIEKGGLNSDDKQDLIPLLFWNPKTKCYVPGCTCLKCPWNRGGFCATEHELFESLKLLLHEFDGDNIIHQVCG